MASVLLQTDLEEKQTRNGESVALVFDEGEAETVLFALRLYKIDMRIDGELDEDLSAERLETALESIDDYIERVTDGEREAAAGFESYIVARALMAVRDLHENGIRGGPEHYQELAADLLNPAVLGMHGMQARSMLEYQEIIYED